jgi:hypothetical protein
MLTVAPGRVPAGLQLAWVLHRSVPDLHPGTVAAVPRDPEYAAYRRLRPMLLLLAVALA